MLVVQPLLERKARALVLRTLQGHGTPEEMAKLDIRLQLLQGRVTVHDLAVAPPDNGNGRARIRYEVPELVLDVGLWSLLRGRLQLQEVRLLRPRIDLVVRPRDPAAERKRIDLQHIAEQVRQALSGYMSSIGVGDLSIEDAMLHYQVALPGGDWAFTVDEVDIAVRGLVVDKALLDAPERMHLDELRITCGAEELTTPDGRSRYQVAGFTLSLAGDSIAIDRLHARLGHRDPADSAVAPMRVSVGGLRLHGLGLKGAWTHDTLEAQRLVLVRPEVRADLLLRKGHRQRGDSLVAVRHLFAEALPQVRLDTLDIVEGRLELMHGAQRLVSIGRIDARILDTRAGAPADSATPLVQPPRDGWLRMADLRGDVGPYAAQLDTLRLGVAHRDLALRGLALTPRDAASTSLPKGRLAALDLVGFDLAAWLRESAVLVDRFDITGAHIRLPSPFHERAANAPRKPHTPVKQARLPLPILMAHAGITRLRVGELLLTGRADLIGHARAGLRGGVGAFVFRAEGLRCPEEPDEPHRDLFADRAELRASNVHLDDRTGALTMHLGGVQATVPARDIVVRDARVRRDARTDVTVNADELRLEGFDLPALLEERGLFLRALRLDQRTLRVELAPPQPDSLRRPAEMPVIARYLHVDTIDIRTDELRVLQGGAPMASVDSFRFELFHVRPDPPHFADERLAFLKDGPRYSGRNIQVHPPGSGLRFEAARIRVDKVNYRSELQEVVVTVDRPGLQARGTAPRVTAADYNEAMVASTDVFALGHMVVHDPVITAHLSPVPKEQGRSAHARHAGHGRPFSQVHAGGLELRNARIDVRRDGAATAHRLRGTLNATLDGADLHLDPRAGEVLRTGPAQVSLGDLRMSHVDANDTTFQLGQLQLRASAIALPRDQGLVVEGMHVDLGPFNFTYASDSMRCQVGGVRYAHDEGRLLLKDIALRPVMDQAAYASAQRYRTDALVMTIDTLVASGLSMRELVADKHYEVRHLLLSGLHLNDLRDHRLPFAPYRVKPLPSRLLQGLRQHMGADTVELRRMRVDYAEIAHDVPDTGRIALTGMHARITGVSTPARARRDPLHVEASGLLQGQGRFRLEVTFEPGHPRDLFRYRFHLGRMDLRAFEPILRPAAHISITRGRLDTLTVLAEMNDDAAIGELQMHYTGLHLRLTGKRDQENALMPTLESWVANAVVRTNRRPGSNDDPSTVYFERLKDRSLFNYLIKTTISGIPGALRLPDKKGRVRRSDEEELKERLMREGVAP